MDYHRRSIRLTGFDYAENGYYFVTVCAWKRLKIFGEIINNQMILNNNGKILEKELIKTEKMRRNIKIKIFQIMPNHVHMILIIKNDLNEDNIQVGAYCNTPLQKPNKFKSPKNNLGSIIRGFKSTVCKQISEISSMGLPIWQRNYFEHIIRNEKEYLKIREYIKLNPIMWERDRNNPKNLNRRGVLQYAPK